MPTHSSILAWEILWMEEPDRLPSTGLHRVGHNWVTNTHKWRLDYLSSETLILNQEQSQTCVYQLRDFSLHNMPLHGLETEFWQNKWSRVHLKKKGKSTTLYSAEVFGQSQLSDTELSVSWLIHSSYFIYSFKNRSLWMTMKERQQVSILQEVPCTSSLVNRN